MLAGLRRGELMALRIEDIDLKAGRMRVERSYDPAVCKFRPPKSRQGRRNVPISSALAPYLRARVLAVEPGDLPNALDRRAVAEGAVGAPLVVVAHPVWQ